MVIFIRNLAGNCTSKQSPAAIPTTGLFRPSLRLPGIVPAPRAGGGHRIVAVRAPFPGHRGALLHDVFVLDGRPLAGEEEDGAAPLAAAHPVELDGLRGVPTAQLRDAAHHVEVLPRRGGE